MSADVAVVILAGGEGRRIGGGKPLRRVGGERLIDRAVAFARLRSNAVAVAVRDERQLVELPEKLIVDDPSVEGPLAGLISALNFAADHCRAFVLTIPVDTPSLPEDLLPRLRGGISATDCALASSGGRLHPVCGLWRSSVLERVETYLATAQRSLRGFAETLGYATVEWDTGPGDPFFNVNTPEDLARARRRTAF